MNTLSFIGYCVKGKNRCAAQNPRQVVLRDGRAAVAGECPEHPAIVLQQFASKAQGKATS